MGGSMIVVHHADGTSTEMTEEQAWEHKLAANIARYGEEEGRRLAEAKWRILHTPNKPWSEMTEGERILADKMQSEHEVNQAMARSGYTSFDDLRPDYEEALLDPLAPSADDDEEFDIGDLVPKEYDYEAAAALTARKARERARGGKGNG